MQFDAFDSFADITLEFPLGDRVFSAPIPDFATGARITRILTAEDADAREKPQEWLWEILLGPAYAEMVAANVPDAFLKRAGQTALQHHLAGREAAVKMWREGPDPLVVKANLEAAVEALSEDSPRSPSTGGATKTRSRASSKGMTSRRS